MTGLCAYLGADIHDGARRVADQALLIEGGRIVGIVPDVHVLRALLTVCVKTGQPAALRRAATLTDMHNLPVRQVSDSLSAASASAFSGKAIAKRKRAISDMSGASDPSESTSARFAARRVSTSVFPVVAAT